MAALDLSDLDAFAAVANRRSFRRAAAERGVSASSLSQAVRDLEARLGVRLLNRTTRSVAPTEAGERLLQRLTPALADIAAAVDQVHVQPGTAAGSLKINAPEPAVELVLAPMVAAFLAAHPLVRLEIRSESALVDIVAAGFDAGVRWDENLAQDMVAVPLSGPQRYVVVAAPALVEAVGRPQVPQDLLGAPCLRIRYSSGVQMPWEFERDGQVLKIDPPSTLVGNSPALLLRAAVDGAGFYATFEGYARADIAAGRLVTVLDDWLPPFPGPRLYYPSRRQVPSALQAFIAFARHRTARGGD